jgi:hypothetical protein
MVVLKCRLLYLSLRKLSRLGEYLTAYIRAEPKLVQVSNVLALSQCLFGLALQLEETLELQYTKQ